MPAGLGVAVQLTVDPLTAPEQETVKEVVQVGLSAPGHLWSQEHQSFPGEGELGPKSVQLVL